jgi:hypothetical protein
MRGISMENHKIAFTKQSISLMWLFSQGETFMDLEIRCSFAMLIFEDKLFDGFVAPYLHVYFLFLILQECWFLYIKLIYLFRFQTNQNKRLHFIKSIIVISSIFESYKNMIYLCVCLFRSSCRQCQGS